MTLHTIPTQTPFEQIDPAVAWEPWTPSAEEPWDLRRASLLVRRASFGGTGKFLEGAVGSDAPTLIAALLHPSKARANEVQAFEAESAELGRSVLGTGDMNQLAAWWLHRMLHSPAPLTEKMTLFWHGHFATGAEKVQDSELMHTQNQVLREHSLGDFRAMVHAIARDPAMLIYLDSASNRKAHANENFARELMELFCLGEGNYTEADVQQLAKCFTGWEIRRKQFRFNPYQHDSSLKQILGTSGIESGEAAIDCVLNSPHMPLFIARKLFRFFISEELEPSNEFLAPLAKRFAESGFRIDAAVEMVLSSRMLLSGWSIGKKIRSPIELVIGWMQTMQCTSNLEFLTERLKSIGQSVFFPPNVKGWEGGRAWINSSTLVGRANLLFDLLHHESTRFNRSTLKSFADSLGAKQPEGWIDWFEKHYMATPLNPSERERLMKLSSSSADKREHSMFAHLASLPQIHLS